MSTTLPQHYHEVLIKALTQFCDTSCYLQYCKALCRLKSWIWFFCSWIFQPALFRLLLSKSRNLAGSLWVMQLTADVWVISLLFLLGSFSAACPAPLCQGDHSCHTHPVQGIIADVYFPPWRGCHCPQALAKALPLCSTAQPELPTLPLEMLLQVLHSQVHAVLQRGRANHGVHHTTASCGYLGLPISAIVAGLSIWAWWLVLLAVQGEA